MVFLITSSNATLKMMLPPDPVYIFKGEMDAVSCVAFKITTDTECMYAGTQTGKVHVWNLKTKREASSFKIGEESCLAINISQEDETTVTQDKSGIISFWKEDNDKWSLVKQIKTDFFGFCKSTIFENKLYTVLKNGKCEVISLKTREVIQTLKTSEGSNLGDIMAFRVKNFQNQRIMLVAYEGNRLILWKVGEDVVKASELQLEECPMAVDFDVNTGKGICGNPSNKMVVFSLDNNFELKVIRNVTLVNAGVASIQIRPDSKLVAVGCWDGRLRLYSWKTFVVLAVLDIHSKTVQDVCFTQCCDESGRMKYFLAAASQDCRISLWDLYN